MQLPWRRITLASPFTQEWLQAEFCKTDEIDSRTVYSALEVTLLRMLFLLISLGVSLLATLLTLRVANRHIDATADNDFSGPQKFHSRAVPRVGGIGIVLGVTASTMVLSPSPQPGWLVLLCAMPAFLAGLVEDLTKSQSPRRRLFFTAISALVGVVVVDAVITRTDLPVLDTIVAVPLGAAAVTVFVVAGVANAVNIIDGFNGLASMCVVMMLATLAYVASSVGDTFILSLALAGIGAVLGFFVWNFPAGLIFLGDGGAYFLGFWVAELGILLIHRNESVSPLFPLMLCIYPVFETIFSIYRKKWIRGISPGIPDGVHLHMLIYKRLVKFGVGSRSAQARTKRNSLTSPYLWMLCVTTMLPATLWWDNSSVLGFYIVIFALVYIGLYWRIVRFRVPRWMVVSKSPHD